jgi:hypothetical protein
MEEKTLQYYMELLYSVELKLGEDARYAKVKELAGRRNAHLTKLPHDDRSFFQMPRANSRRYW